MELSTGSGAEELQSYQVAQEHSVPSVEEAFIPLREVKQDLDLIFSLIADERTVVESLFDALIGLTRSLPRVPVDATILQEILGGVDRAHVSKGGKLVYTLIDGGVGSVDLSVKESRDLLVKVIEDIVPTIRGISDGSIVLEETVEEVLDVEPVIVEPPEEIVEAPEPEQAEEPSESEEIIPEELEVEEVTEELPALEEPPAIEEPQAIEEQSVIEEPASEPEEPYLPELPEFTVPVDVGDESQDQQEADEDAVVERKVPAPIRKSIKDPQLNGLRRKVRREREQTRRQMKERRRVRAAYIARLREQTGRAARFNIEEEPKGILGQVKGLFSRILLRKKKK
jgi:hypothetical protein